MNIFLDLEETIIKDWFEPTLLLKNIEFIKKTISELMDKFLDFNLNITIFSFAIIDDKDLNIFKNTLQEAIERSLDIEINNVWVCSKENLFKLSEKRGVLPLPSDSVNDIFLGNQKEEVFNLIVDFEHRGEISILFDDTVKNSIQHIFDGDLFDNNKVVTTKIMINV